MKFSYINSGKIDACNNNNNNTIVMTCWNSQNIILPKNINDNDITRNN